MTIVHIKPDGHTFSVNPGETVLAAALRQGYHFPHRCRNAVCGTCKGLLLEGQVRYEYPGRGKPTPLPGLSDEEREMGYALFCSAIPETDLVIEIPGVTAPGQLPIKKLNYNVDSIQLLSSSIYQVWLFPRTNEKLAYHAGQYLEILHADTSPHPFSIANAPSDDGRIELQIRRIESSPYTINLLESMEKTGVVRIAGPFGSCTYHAEPNYPSILIAGGTGFAPSKAIIEQALSMGLQNPMHLYWGARNQSELYMHELAQQWNKHVPLFHYIPVLMEPDDQWTGETGLVHETVLKYHPSFAQHHVYASGPPEMVYAAFHALQKRGLQRAFIYSDMLDWPGE